MTITELTPSTIVDPATAGIKPRYENFIGGDWVPPSTGEYHDDLAPATGRAFTQVPCSGAPDIELALDAAHAAKDAWGEASTTERARVLHAIADAIEDNLEALAVAESYDNGKPIRETRAADVPLAADHFRYFASVIRGEEGTSSEIDKDTVAYHFREPLGVVGQIIPFNFPLLMAAWKMAPAIAAGNCTVLKPASPTPWSILKFAELIQDVLPAGVINIVNGPGAEIGRAAEPAEPHDATAQTRPRPSEPEPGAREAGRPERPQGMVPGRERRRLKVERGAMRVIATGGIIGIAVVLGAVLVGQDVAGWIVGLAVGLTSVILAALLWSSRQL